MSFSLILILLIPILFVIGTVYSSIKEQKKLENGQLKSILAKREQLKQNTLSKLSKKEKWYCSLHL